ETHRSSPGRRSRCISDRRILSDGTRSGCCHSRFAVTRVKICGITEFEDARDAALLGADAIGLNFYPSSPRYIQPARAAKIVEKMAPFVMIVGIFVNHPDLQNLEDFAVSLVLQAVELHVNETADYGSLIERVN